MKRFLKVISILALLLFQNTVFSQVGINTTDPKTTLEVVGKPTDNSTADGILVPKMTGNQLKAKDLVYGADQVSVMVYVTAAASPTTAKTTNVTSAGYYYFDGIIWQKMGIPFGATYGTAVLGSNVTVGTSGSDTFADVGLQVTLPSAGTYSVRSTVNGQITDASSVGNLIIARFVDGSNVAKGEDWTVVSRDGDNSTSTSGFASGTGEAFITVTGSTVIKLQAKISDNTAPTRVILAGTSSGGHTYMLFHKIAGN